MVPLVFAYPVLIVVHRMIAKRRSRAARAEARANDW
jgi:hypothetical protein